MRLLIQRVLKASVCVEDKIVGKIGSGVLVFLAIKKTDTLDCLEKVIDKLIHLRIFSDKQNKMHLSLIDTQAEILVVSQFTLYANCMKGRRPSFSDTADPLFAKKIYEHFIQLLKQKIKCVDTGVFGANMQVESINDGPVTFCIDF